MVSEVQQEGGGMTAQVQTLQVRHPNTREWYTVPSDPVRIAQQLGEPVYVIERALSAFHKCGMARYAKDGRNG